jgi:signal transduction histidine kinase
MDFNQTAEVLISFPGNLVYHMIVTMSVVLLFSLSRLLPPASKGQQSRWSTIAAGLLLLQVLYLFVGASSQLISGNLAAILPSLDRFLSLCSVGFFAWGFIFPDPPDRVNRIFAALITIGVLAVLSELLIAPDPRRADQVWTIVGLLGLIVIMVRITTQRPEQWFLVQSAVVILLAGYFLHLVGNAEPPALQGMVRWSELAAYPLFVLAAARALTIETMNLTKGSGTASVVDLQSDIINDHRPEKLLPELGELLSSSRDEALAKNAVRTIANVMRAELCLLLTPPDLSGQFAIGATYDLIHEHFLGGAPLEAATCPILAAALSRRKPVSLPAQSRAPDLQTLEQILSIESTGPLLMVPMLARGHLEGGILLLSPFVRKRWHDSDRETLEEFAQHLAIRFRQLRGQVDIEPSDEPESSAQIAVLEEEIDRLSEMLREASEGEQAAVRDDNMAALLEMHEEAQSTIQSLESEVYRLSVALAQSSNQDTAAQLDQMAERLQHALQELATTRAQLTHTKLRANRQEDLDLDLTNSLLNQLRQPLGAMQKSIALLRQQSTGKLESEQLQLLAHVHAGLDRADALLEQLARAIHAEIVSVHQPLEPVDLIACLENALTRSGAPMHQKNLTLRMDFPESLPYVLGNPQNITQIFIHLINNAIIVSPDQAELVISTDMRSEDGAEFLTCSITDRGQGIPAQEIHRVFDLDPQTTDSEIQGVGEDLANLNEVRNLSEAIGGRVWVESQPGQGSSFTVLFVLAQPQPGTDGG